jgi:heterotetrameric sarcosine oxidase gamma subunit
MAELSGRTVRQSAIGALLAPRRIGPQGREPSVRLSEAPPRAIWQIAAWHAGDVAPLCAAFAEHLGLVLPEGRDAAGSDRCALAFQVAPRRWWLVVQEARRSRFVAGFTMAPANRAALTDLSHARTVLHLSGPASRSVLAKLCRIDLHPLALPPGRVAQTPLGQIAALIHTIDDLPSFDLYLPRSFAESATVGLIDAAAEFGLEVSERDPGSRASSG